MLEANYRFFFFFFFFFSQGNYGKVYRGTLKNSQGQAETVAVKTLHTVGDIEDLKREFTIMKVCLCDFVISVFIVFCSDQFIKICLYQCSSLQFVVSHARTV